MAKTKKRKYSILLPTGKTRAPKTAEERSVLDLLDRFEGLTENAQWAFCLALIHRGDTLVSKTVDSLLERLAGITADWRYCMDENRRMDKALTKRKKNNALAAAKEIKDRMANEGKSLRALAGDSLSEHERMKKALSRAKTLETNQRKWREEAEKAKKERVTDFTGTLDGPTFLIHCGKPAD